MALRRGATRPPAQGRGTKSVPRQGHNTPIPLKRSPPASFKRLLGRVRTGRSMKAPRIGERPLIVGFAEERPHRMWPRGFPASPITPQPTPEGEHGQENALDCRSASRPLVCEIAVQEENASSNCMESFRL